VKAPVTLSELEVATRAEVAKYAAFSFNAKLYAVLDDEQKLYTVVTVPHLPRPFPARVVVMAQVVDDKVIVIEDVTDKPLVEALMVNGGIPREQIVLAYQGEPLQA
jgi:hypothetical protein